MILTRAAVPKADIGWVWVAAVLPDIPWITQRILNALPIGVSPLDIRLFAAVQSAFPITLFAAGGLACFARRKPETFGILAVGALLHLLLDAIQTKWANGVLLAVPFDWRLLNFGLFWPEDWPTYGLTGLGALTFLLAWRHERPAPWRPRFPGTRWTVTGALLLTAYMALPIVLSPIARAENLHFVATLQGTGMRTGHSIEIDRARLTGDSSDPAIRHWTGETFGLDGTTVPESNVDLSLKGVFSAPDRISVTRLHAHPGTLRDSFTILGLVLVLAWWGYGFLCDTRTRRGLSR